MSSLDIILLILNLVFGSLNGGHLVSGLKSGDRFLIGVSGIGVIASMLGILLAITGG